MSHSRRTSRFDNAQSKLRRDAAKQAKAERRAATGKFLASNARVLSGAFVTAVDSEADRVDARDLACAVDGLLHCKVGNFDVLGAALGVGGAGQAGEEDDGEELHFGGLGVVVLLWKW